MKTIFSLGKAACFFVISCMAGTKLSAQDSHLSDPDANQISFVNFDAAKDVFTMSGSRISATGQADIDGSPYLLSSWSKGTVMFVNGKVYRDGLLQLNLASNELQFLNNGKPLVFALPVKGFTLIDTTGNIKKTAWFNSGYPKYGQHNESTFYQVLATGQKVQLLKFISKHTTDQYQYNGTARLYYKTSEDLFVYNTRTQKMQYIGNNEGSVEKVLDAIDPRAHDLVAATGKKKLSEDDIIAIAEKINRL